MKKLIIQAFLSFMLVNIALSTFASDWHYGIRASIFWIGERAAWVGAHFSPPGTMSSWDPHWRDNYGGIDHPIQRIGYFPARFAPTENPFYVALPFNDTTSANRELTRKFVPVAWTKRNGSKCFGRWIEIRAPATGKRCFAQWMDVGPWTTDDASYVFGHSRPKAPYGIDVSPAVRDYLGIHSGDRVDWRFADEQNLPFGPWIQAKEEAIIFQAIKRKIH
ncbi:hypothetical protein [Methylacidiphilum kamchatkense]|uniref:Uncharacterized protein n=1 Tax=Methylacidiphilum kamchatkense Kam1 TaxID=1202785 RepID=A0A516TME7_9BACT|nr:hypothetical protein [Methylacidiphilum kamchatkense]QDQ42420.1 hypothetical protein kam1_1192 [Methylacidiphilum kamchatkense Kam1]